ncbi:fumarylacetoacetase [Nocardioides sp. HDW12B]|uniref:fumarylacetoacetase n=1 Tax=Nocardioides sp. HDW12B TaxID=2714939 RepID=UPI00140977CC|nr:fumarylacetoacetase [Nocardioides sp. HDW12B]QIK67615.1 fumarylacetoacetase [Nocardioides sp. HDW12B]
MSEPAPGSWVPDAAGSGFDLDHLPYGVVTVAGGPPRCGVRIGPWVLDVASAATAAPTPYAEPARLLGGATLDPFLAAGPPAWDRVRAWLHEVLADPTARTWVRPHLHPVAEVAPRLAFTVADYVDFYASEHHATNVGRIFRPGSEPLHPSWRHLPIGYHGRAGTVVVSGADVVRPRGLRREPEGAGPTFGPTRRLDLEAELGLVVGVGSTHGVPVPVREAPQHLFGVVGLNDWSARDVQAFETVPLGPFLGKSFATSVSAWVTPLAALDAAWVDLPGQDPPPAPHLAVDGPAGLAIDVEVEVAGQVVARPPYASMYWSPWQMLAHLTSNGASLRTGDLLGSGTISGPGREQRGSLLELSWGGTEDVVVGSGTRRFLEDGDEVVLRYAAPSTSGGRLTLGEVRGRVLPAR